MVWLTFAVTNIVELYASTVVASLTLRGVELGGRGAIRFLRGVGVVRQLPLGELSTDSNFGERGGVLGGAR